MNTQPITPGPASRKPHFTDKLKPSPHSGGGLKPYQGKQTSCSLTNKPFKPGQLICVTGIECDYGAGLAICLDTYNNQDIELKGDFFLFQGDASA